MSDQRRPEGKQKYADQVYRGYTIKFVCGWWKAYSQTGREIISDATTVREAKRRIDDGLKELN